MGLSKRVVSLLGTGLCLSSLSLSAESQLNNDGMRDVGHLLEEGEANLPSSPDHRLESSQVRRSLRKKHDPKTVQLKSKEEVVGNLVQPNDLVATSDAEKQIDHGQGSTGPKRIFGCMVRGSVVESLFPRFEGKVINLGYGQRHKLSDLNDRYKLDKDEDVIVGLLHQAEHCIDNVIDFPGRQIYINPEPLDWMPCTPQRQEDHLFYLNMAPELAEVQRNYNYLPPKSDITVIGPHETTKQSLQVFVGIIYFVMHRSGEELQTALRKLVLPDHRPRNTHEHFMVYLQSHYVKEREDSVALLAKAFYERFGNKVHVGKHCQGSSRPLQASGGKARFCGPPSKETLEHIEIIGEEKTASPTFMNNDNLMRHFKYAIAFENMDRDAYVSEKIFNAFLSGAVPVYWGTKDVFKVFNADAFIYFDMDDPQAAIDQITFLEEHQEAYEIMLQQPILADGWETVKDFFSLREDVGHGRLRKMIMSKMGYDAHSV